MKEQKKYLYLNAEEFSALSESEQADYYEGLANKREEACTYEQKQLLAEAYFALGEYEDAAVIAQELSAEADEQRSADEAYNIRKFKMGILVISAICASVAVAAVIITLISMG